MRFYCLPITCIFLFIIILTWHHDVPSQLESAIRYGNVYLKHFNVIDSRLRQTQDSASSQIIIQESLLSGIEFYSSRRHRDYYNFGFNIPKITDSYDTSYSSNKFGKFSNSIIIDSSFNGGVIYKHVRLISIKILLSADITLNKINIFALENGR